MPKELKSDLPRYVLMLQDTQTIVNGLKGEQFYSVQIGFDSKEQLLHAESKLDGRNELLNVIDTFFSSVDELEKSKAMRPKKKA